MKKIITNECIPIRILSELTGVAAIKDVRMVEGRDDQTLLSDDIQWPIFQHRILKAIEHFDEAKLNGCYGEAVSIYPFSLLCESR